MQNYGGHRGHGTCDRHSNGPPHISLSQLPEPVNMLCYKASGTQVCWSAVFTSPGGFNIVTKAIKSRRGESGKSEWWNIVKTPLAAAGFENGRRGPWAKGFGYPLKAKKGKETISPLDHPERNAALMTPWFQFSETLLRLQTSKTVRS